MRRGAEPPLLPGARRYERGSGGRSGVLPRAGADSVRVCPQGVSSTSGWWSSWPGTCRDPCAEGSPACAELGGARHRSLL